MTREEALQILDTIPTIGEQVDALEMAIKALEQEPSGDLISREETLTAFADYVGSGMSMDDYDALWNIVAKMPAVRQESKTGHWVWNTNKTYCKCSECGIGMGHTEYDYCPNCGARMIESREREGKS